MSSLGTKGRAEEPDEQEGENSDAGLDEVRAVVIENVYARHSPEDEFRARTS